MASATFEQPDSPFPFVVSRDDRHGWGFGLLLATVATLFVRPADLIASFEDWPLYQFAIISCLVVSARTIFHQLSNRNLLAQPVSASLILLLVSVVLSHLSHGFVWGARMSLVECSKVAALYVLILGLVNTPYRLIKFVQWLTMTITFVAGIALLDRFEFITLSAMESIRDRGVIYSGSHSAEYVERIRGTGIFQDPNDFGLILVTGLVLSFSFLLRPNAGWLRHFWLVPCLILIGTLAMTHSRGALLSLVCAVPAAVTYRRSKLVGIVSLISLPTLALFFSARMADVSSMVEGTGQSRIQIWSESLTVWKQHPVFGLGEGLLVEELGVVAHNSFLHCFAELGFVGGGAFVSCFLLAGIGLWQLRHWKLSESMSAAQRDVEKTTLYAEQFDHHRTYIFAVLVAYVAGILTLSRQFVMPTYLILGLASAAFTIRSPSALRIRTGNRAIFICLIVSFASLMAFYTAVRVFLHR